MNDEIQLSYEFGPFRLDLAERRLFRAGHVLPLTPKAFEILALLVERSGRLVLKEELMSSVWPDAVVEENNLNKYISTLRKTLGESGSGQTYIETVPRHGYRFIAPVTETGDAEIELVVEKHTFSRIVAESEEQAIDLPAPPAPAAASRALIGQSGLRRAGLIALGTSASVMCLSLFVWFGLLRGRASTARPEMTVERLTNGGDVHGAMLSPDGKYFVYVENEGVRSRLILRQTGQGNPLEIVAPAERYIDGTTFSPDGQFIYFTAFIKQDKSGELYRVPALGGPQTRLVTDIYSPVTFSPDGKQIAFIRFDEGRHESSLIISSADGSNEKVLATRKGIEWFAKGGASWSPDGSQIACSIFTGPTPDSSPGCRLIGVDPGDGVMQPLTPEKWDQCGRIAWTGDGKGLVFIGTKHGEDSTLVRDQVWYIAQPDGEVHRITTELSSRHHLESLSLTPDSGALLVVPFNRTSQLWSMDAGGDSRTVVQLTSGTGDGRGGIASLPDGSIVFTRRTANHVDLWQINADGAQPKQLTTAPSFLEEARATADGRYLVFSSDRDGRSHLYRVDANGSNLTQLTSGESAEVDSDCSPDGKWIVYESQAPLKDQSVPPSLWKIPVEGGAPIRLTDGMAKSPHFSPDGKYISYTYIENGRWKMGIISADGGAPVKTFEPADGPELNVGSRFTPDGRALTYLAALKTTTNIWLQPLDGGPPHPLTDFQSGDIYNYAFSQDGSRLYLARGYDIHDVTLMKNFSY